MRPTSPNRNPPSVLASSPTGIFHIDPSGQIVAMSEDAVQILAACPDLISIDDDNRLALAKRESDAHVWEPLHVAGGQQHHALQLQSGATKTKLTLHVLLRAGVGATVVIFATGLEGDAHLSHLTPRERDMLHFAAQGIRRDRMAHRLGISIAAVDFHCANLRRKMGAKTTSEAVARAFASIRK